MVAKGLARSVAAAGVTTFVVSVGLGLASRVFLSRMALGLGALVLALIVLVGIIFDIIGTAVTAANEEPFHSMASKRVPGAKQAIRLIRNADRVANICNDMVGDVCGTLSGAVGAALVYAVVVHHRGLSEPIMSTAVVAFVAAATVAGKSAGKAYAIGESGHVMFAVGKLLARLELSTGLAPFKPRANRRGR